MPIDFDKIPSPCYVLDEYLFRKNLERIKYVKESAGVEIILALKGFAMWGAFPILKEYISKAAASSVNEARLAYEELGNKAHTYAPAYSDSDWEEYVKYSKRITFNSLSQLNRFLPKLQNTENEISVGLRINPEFSDVQTELYNPCATGTRLGVTSQVLGKNLPEGVEGLHFHTLCESTSFDLEKTLQVVEQKFAPLLHQAKWINMGGGHLMTHKDYDVNHLIDLLKHFKSKYNIEIILEPGSAFAWETGYLISTVLDIVENGGIATAILDISFANHLPDCLEMPYKPTILGASDEKKGKPTYRMGGNSCLAGDYIGNWSFDKELEVGDKIVFNDMIHYTMVKTTTFNGITHPSIGIWNSNGFRLLKKFGYDDYKNRLS